MLKWITHNFRLILTPLFIFENMKHGKESKYLGFEPITLMPFEPHLIMPELMTHKQVIIIFIIFSMSA